MTPTPNNNDDLRGAGLRLQLGDESRRLTIQATPGTQVDFGPEHEVASDVVALIYDGPVLLGWGDDYGTVTHPDGPLSKPVKDAAEAFVEAAADLWTALLEAEREQ